MRTIIDIPEELIEELKYLGEKGNMSRAALIREAIQEYVAKRKPAQMSEAFGLWKSRQIDGLAYEQRIRSEWED